MPIQHGLLRSQPVYIPIVLLLIVKSHLLEDVLFVGEAVLQEGQIALGDLLEELESVEEFGQLLVGVGGFVAHLGLYNLVRNTMSDTHSGQEDEERKSRGSEQGEPETLGFLGEELENSEASHFSFVRSVEQKEGEQEEGNNKEEIEQSAERTASEPVEGHKAGK
jgi:hypothetical protein